MRQGSYSNSKEEVELFFRNLESEFKLKFSKKYDVKFYWHTVNQKLNPVKKEYFLMIPKFINYQGEGLFNASLIHYNFYFGSLAGKKEIGVTLEIQYPTIEQNKLAHELLINSNPALEEIEKKVFSKKGEDSKTGQKRFAFYHTLSSNFFDILKSDDPKNKKQLILEWYLKNIDYLLELTYYDLEKNKLNLQKIALMNKK